MRKSISKLPGWLLLGLVFPLAFLNGWLFFLLVEYLQPLVSILIAATLLAFLLDLPILFLQKRGVKRGWAVGLVLLLALLILGILGLILIPLILQQLSELTSNLPTWIESGNQQLQDLEKWAIAQKLPIAPSELITQAAEKLSSVLKSLTSQLLSFVLGAIGSILNIILILVLTVFLVLSGESVWNGVFSWLPSPWDVQLRESMRQTFEKYFASQAILAGILSVAQIIVFAILGVPYAVLFGFGIGVTTLIPYASAFTIILVSLLLTLQDFGLGLRVLVAAIVVGQINDNIVAPRLMGGMTGLNPVWLIISMLIGGKVGGLLGLLLAVPLASVIKSTADTIRVSSSNSQGSLPAEETVPNPEEENQSANQSASN
ncbi:MAG: AI-2E family transporter [Xenococcaceae cyanobacterium]